MTYPIPDEAFEPTKIDCAYAAGFFDGEGCVHIALGNRKDCVDPTYSLRATVSQVVPQPLEFMRARWGGQIVLRPAKPPRKAFSVWTLHGREASDFLFDILPSLLVKREQAILAIRFQFEKGAGQGKGRGDRTRAPVFHQFYSDLRGMNS